MKTRLLPQLVVALALFGAANASAGTIVRAHPPELTGDRTTAIEEASTHADELKVNAMRLIDRVETAYDVLPPELHDWAEKNVKLIRTLTEKLDLDQIEALNRDQAALLQEMVAGKITGDDFRAKRETLNKVLAVRRLTCWGNLVPRVLQELTEESEADTRIHISTTGPEWKIWLTMDESTAMDHFYRKSVGSAGKALFKDNAERQPS